MEADRWHTVQRSDRLSPNVDPRPTANVKRLKRISERLSSGGKGSDPLADRSITPNLAAYRAMLENPTLDPEWPNTRRWRAVGLSSGGGSANARSMAQLYSILTDTTSRQRGPLLSAETMAAATRERIAGINQVSGLYGRFGAGFLLNSDGIMGPNAQAFGHGGWGGSIAFGDPAHRLGIAYVMNQMRIAPMDQPDTRAPRLIGATYESLHRLPASLATQ